jgi:hypothetical protein
VLYTFIFLNPARPINLKQTGGAFPFTLTALDAVLCLRHDLHPSPGKEPLGRHTLHHAFQDHDHLNRHTLGVFVLMIRTSFVSGFVVKNSREI